MAGEHAVITGTFADLKLVKTRSTVQVIIECPIEQAKQVTDLLGFPLPGQEIHVAVARLSTNRGTPKTQTNLAQQAGIACGTSSFHIFLQETHPHVTSDTAAQMVRDICGVASRRELDSDPAKGRLWQALHGRYIEWLDH
jgi:hypothetical protein